MVDSPTMKKSFVVSDIKPLDLYDCTKAKICASVAWLLAKSYGCTGMGFLFYFFRIQAGWLIQFLDFVWKPQSLCCPYSLAYMWTFIPILQGKAHGCSIAQRFSAQRTNTMWKGTTHATHFWQMSFVLLGRVSISCVCVREVGLLPWPYHANPFSRICSRLVSVPNCSQTVLGMFLIQTCRLFFLFIQVSRIL